MGVLRDWYREKKRQEREFDKKISPRFPLERLQDESFSEFRRRLKREKKTNPF